MLRLVYRVDIGWICSLTPIVEERILGVGIARHLQAKSSEVGRVDMTIMTGLTRQQVRSHHKVLALPDPPQSHGCPANLEREIILGGQGIQSRRQAQAASGGGVILSVESIGWNGWRTCKRAASGLFAP